MDKFRVKALVASMEQHNSDLNSEPLNLDCPLSVAMEDAEVAKAILQVAAVAAIATAIGYAIGRLIGWMANSITGSGGSSISSAASGSSQHIQSGMNRVQGYAPSFTGKMVTFTITGWAAHCINSNMEPEVEFITLVRNCSILEKWVILQGRALADALSSGKTDPKAYELDPSFADALARGIGKSLEDISSDNIRQSPGHSVKSGISAVHTEIRNASVVAHKSQEDVVKMLKDLESNVKTLADAAPEVESEFKKSEEELDLLRKQLDKMKADSENLSPECKAAANRTRSEILAGIGGLATGMHIVRDLFTNARHNFDIAERALRESRK